MSIDVERAGSTVNIKAIPALREIKDTFGNFQRHAVLGIKRSTGPGDVKTERLNLIEAFIAGTGRTWMVVDQTLTYIGGIFTGRESADQLGGPIRIAQVSGQLATLPLLDGGHLLFYVLEVLRGKPLSDRAQEVGFRIGLAIVAMLMIFATFNDIKGVLHLWAS